MVYFLGTTKEWNNMGKNGGNENLIDADRYHISFDGNRMIDVTDKTGLSVSAGESTYSVVYSSGDEAVASVNANTGVVTFADSVEVGAEVVVTAMITFANGVTVSTSYIAIKK